jgi:hypothetical protein
MHSKIPNVDVKIHHLHELRRGNHEREALFQERRNIIGMRGEKGGKNCTLEVIS